MARLLLRSGIVVTQDPKLGVLPTGDVLVEGDRIAAIAARLDAPDAEVVDCAGHFVLPGLINAHCHVTTPASRSLREDGGNPLFHMSGLYEHLPLTWTMPPDDAASRHTLELGHADVVGIEHLHEIVPQHADRIDGHGDRQCERGQRHGPKVLERAR